MSDKGVFLLSVSEIYLKLLITVLLLILSNTPVVIAYYRICLYVFL